MKVHNPQKIEFLATLALLAVIGAIHAFAALNHIALPPWALITLYSLGLFNLVLISTKTKKGSKTQCKSNSNQKEQEKHGSSS